MVSTFRPLLVAMLLVLAAPAAAQSRAKAEGELVKALTPLVLYLAQGEANACGDGCSEWIAADGAFDQGSAVRFRRFVGRLAGRKLPVFFNSPGGIVAEAIAVGRFLHQADLTAGVARTVPDDCKRANRNQCADLKRSGRPLAAELRPARAQCNSACVYALIGAKVRQVPPGVRVGIHSDKLVRIYSDGRMVAPSRAQLSVRERIKIDEDHRRLKSYVVEMGMSADLVDAASKVSHASVHLLTRDEVARYGIDAREFQETRWTVDDAPWNPPAVVKYISEGKGDAAKEYRTSFLRLSCRGAGMVRLDYLRGLASFETKVATTITLTSGDRKLVLSRRGQFDISGGSELLSEQFPMTFIDAAAQEPAISLTESSSAAGGPAQSRVVKLSTAGLAQALNALRSVCGRES